MAVQWTTNKQFTLPSSAVGATVTPSGSVGVNGAWSVIGTPNADSLLTGMTFRTAYVDWVFFQIDIGTGAPGAEVVIATIVGTSSTVGGINDNGMYVTFTIPIDLLPSGVPISARIRLDTTSVIVWLVSVTYLKKPIVGNILSTTKVLKVSNAVAAPVSIIDGGSSWTDGAWGTLIASPSADLVLAGIMFYVASGHIYQYEFDIGIGASPAVVTTYGGSARGYGLPFILMLKSPLDAFPTASKISIRWRNSATGPYVGAQAYASIMYYEKPL